MSDIAITFDGKTLSADYSLVGSALALDDGLTSAIINSIFIARRARTDDVMPEDARIPGERASDRAPSAFGTRDRRGWWGDLVPPREAVAIGKPHVTGSRLWLLAREKQTPETLRRAEDYVREGLQPLIDYGLVKTFEIEAFVPKTGFCALKIVAVQPDSNARRYELTWRTHAV